MSGTRQNLDNFNKCAITRLSRREYQRYVNKHQRSEKVQDKQIKATPKSHSASSSSEISSSFGYICFDLHRLCQSRMSLRKSRP